MTQSVSLKVLFIKCVGCETKPKVKLLFVFITGGIQFMLDIIQIPARNDNYIYLLHETESGQTAVVDPCDAEPVLAVLQKNSWQLDYIFNTHHHADHIGGNQQLKKLTACKVVAAKVDSHRIPDIDIAVNDGDRVWLGDLSWLVIATPGHTLGHIVYYSADSQTLFCGDTLFSMGCGRLFEGNAKQMWQSLKKLAILPIDTRVIPGHGGDTTIAKEKRNLCH